MRRLVWFAAFPLLLAACSGGRAAPTGRPAAGDRGATTTAPAEGGPTSTPAAPAGTTPRPSTTPAPGAAGRTSTTTTTARAPGEAAQAPGQGATLATPADDGSGGPPGAFARTLLRPRPAATVVVERQQQAGAAPSATAVDFARDTLRRVTAKPVEVTGAVALAGGARSWSADDLRRAADAAAQVPQGGARAVVRVLFVHGTFEGDGSILGVAVRGDVLAVFSDSVDDATTPVLTGATIEEAVLVHELGHVLGLVDLARDTGRADKDHPGHSTNSRSVMYWAVESSLIGQVIGGPPPRDFDAADLADLAALRDGA